MIIKKFVGKTEEEAVAAARKELGEGVTIMNVRTVKRKGLMALVGKKQLEVTAALEEEPVQSKPKNTLTKALVAEQPEFKGPVSILTQNTNAENIEKKLDNLQALLESRLKMDEEKVAQNEETANEKGNTSEQNREEKAEDENPELDKFFRLLYNTMLDNEVDEKYANQILEDIDKSKKSNVPFDYILANTYQKMVLKFGKSEGICPAEKGPKVVLFLGPTGVGKTTTIAKVASSFSMEEKKKIALLTSDTYRIAAAEQLRTYANILEVPFRVIYTEEELVQAVEDFKEYDYIFVDTAGHSHHNEEQLSNMKSLQQALEGVAEYQSFLVLSATTKYKDMLKIVEKYNSFTGYQLIFTKLDETNSLGNILNVKLQTDTPIAYVTSGQNVPSDIEKFNPQKTVKQILGGGN